MMSNEALKMRIICCLFTLFCLFGIFLSYFVSNQMSPVLTVGEIVWNVFMSSFGAVGDGFCSMRHHKDGHWGCWRGVRGQYLRLNFQEQGSISKAVADSETTIKRRD